MKIELECIPCLARQALTALRMLELPPQQQLQILREVLKFAATIELGDFPPAVPSSQMHRMIRSLTGSPDPFKTVKEEYNAIALGLEPHLRSIIQKASDPLYMAIKLAIIGNVIDFGVHHQRIDLNQKIREFLERNLSIDVYAQFKQDLQQHSGVFVLLDNAGEIVFDKLLVEELKKAGKEVVCAVKGGPIINDATLQDAQRVGLDRVCKVISNGNDEVGTVLEHCSDEFLSYFNYPNMLIISKGQANYETLNRESRRIYFLLQAKCEVLVRIFGHPLGSLIFTTN